MWYISFWHVSFVSSVVRVYEVKFHELSNVQAQRHIFALQSVSHIHTHTHEPVHSLLTYVYTNQHPKSDKQKACDENFMHLPYRNRSNQGEMSAFNFSICVRFDLSSTFKNELIHKVRMAKRQRDIVKSHRHHINNIEATNQEKSSSSSSLSPGTENKNRKLIQQTNYDVVSIFVFVLVRMPLLSCAQYDMRVFAFVSGVALVRELL